MRIVVLPLLCICTSMPWLALAQNVNYRLDRLERDLQFLQKRIYREGAEDSATEERRSIPVGYGTQALPQLQVQLSEVAQSIRVLRGEIEQLQHQQNMLADKLERFEQDSEFRFTAFEQRLPVASPPVIGRAEEPLVDSDASPAVAPVSTPLAPVVEAVAPLSIAKKEPEESVAELNPQRARDAYNRSFRLLNQGAYEEAAMGFKAFINSYPKDPLIGNVYYWLGETHYVSSRYVQAADAFRKGFEALSNGPKAPDNLYKLALSLSQIKKTREACVVLAQIGKKYSDRDSSVITKAQAEYERLSCN